MLPPALMNAAAVSVKDATLRSEYQSSRRNWKLNIILVIKTDSTQWWVNMKIEKQLTSVNDVQVNKLNR